MPGPNGDQPILGMGLSNVFAMMQMQNNQYRANNIGLEARVLQSEGYGAPQDTAANLMTVPTDSGDLSPRGVLANARAQLQGTAQEFQSAYAALTPQQRHDIDARVQQRMAADQQNGLPTDPVGARIQESIGYAAQSLQQSLGSGTPVDQGLNRLFVNGSRYNDASQNFAMAQLGVGSTQPQF